jgi:AcrR family transcriptional regulator
VPVQEQSEPQTANNDSETRRALKRVARRLFAERGIRPVSVREIAREAGQRNQGAVAYHFGTKEALVVELLTEGAERIETRRRAMLEAMEAQGGPATLEEAVAAIVMPSASFSDEDAEYGSHFNRFLLQLDAADSRFVDRHLEGRWSEAYQHCLDHLRRLMPGLTRADQNRRLLFLGAYVSGLLAKREEMMADAAQAHPTWRAPATLADIIRTASALLQA